MRGNVSIFIIIFFIFVAGSVFSSGKFPSGWPMKLPQGDYLDIFHTVSEIDDKFARYRNVAKSSLYAVLGDEERALASFWGMEGVDHRDVIKQLSRTPSEFCKKSGYSDSCWSEGFSATRKLAQGKRLVFLNEAHHMSRHRAFLEALLPDLWKMGYRYLAVEALNEETIESLAENGTLPLTRNVYLHDPQFANLLRTAHALGFTLIAYEQTREQMEECANCTSSESRLKRDKDQSRNLYNKTFAKDTEARVVAYGGFKHIYKCERVGENENVRKNAGWFLNKKLDGNMVSVDQTEIRFVNSESLDIMTNTIPPVLAFPGNDCVDLRLAHDISKKSTTSQNWRGWTTKRQEVAFLVSDNNLNFPLMVEVRNSAMSSRSIPIDRVTLWKPGTARLWAPTEGTASFVAVTSDGQRMTLIQD